MVSLLDIGQNLRGRVSTYSIVKELHWAADQGASGRKCIVKSIWGHWRLENEVSILRKYQAMSPLFCPLEDEIVNLPDLPSIIFDLGAESKRQRLSRPDIKKVAKSDSMVHTDIKLDNIFVDLGQQGDPERFTDIQLGDYGGVVSKYSKFATELGHLIGASFTCSPKAQLGLLWGTLMDIWSFGNAILTLLYGGGFHLFNPANEGYKPEDEHYELVEIADDNAAGIIDFIYSMGPPTKPFRQVTCREIPPADWDFILKIMKLDYRDRPTADQLLEDEWFSEESEDTREPLPPK
ncbi:serine/threonine protein kinase [Colletotrichum navitas]|uniref:Serine/threonine protein kinase n=1 Tax=Colletotrichum navitas TaxID=681940 RepID=A0AAD8PYD1_9PEZI|nr:serine/threonine protein kinase [Colletotrichum navitas]KAK1585978.1 serine/threonine protein kinase [Colletotrichum navitas]